MSIKLKLIPVLLLALLLVQCESAVTDNEVIEEINTSNISESDEVEFVGVDYNAFINEHPNALASPAKGSKKERYRCVISTLNKPGDDELYTYRSYYIKFPRRIIKAANNKSKYRGWVHTSNDWYARHSYRLKDGASVIRTVQCIIPDAEAAEKILEKKLRKFGNTSWLQGYKEERQQDNTLSDEMLVDYFIFICTETAYVNTGGIELINGVPEIVISGHDACVDGYWEFIDDGDPQGGGGGLPGGGQDPFPCDPTMPCVDDIGGGGFALNEDADPCNTGYGIFDHHSSAEIFSALWTASYADKPESQRKERFAIVFPNSTTGGFTFNMFPENSHLLREAGPCFLDGLAMPSYNDMPSEFYIIHTHPFEDWELQDCTNTGKPLTYRSRNVPNDDASMYRDIFSEYNGKVKGAIVLDGDNIAYFQNQGGMPPSNPQLIARCSY